MQNRVWYIAAVMALFFAACTTVSAPKDDEEAAVSSSSGKSKVSSSSKKSGSSSSKKSEKSSSSVKAGDNEKLLDDCVGEADDPWDGTTAKEFACGTGTKLSPYIILTAEQLAHLSFVIGANDKNFIDKYYKLGADIQLNKGEIIDSKGALVADSTKLHKWTPIGNSNVSFAGNFDGDGHTVGGMFINTTSTHNGLFGSVSGTVQNLTVENGWVKGGKYTAGVVGYNVGTLNNLKNASAVTATDECVGGIVGSSNQKNYRDNSVLKNAKNFGIISGNKNVGGVAGCATFVIVENLQNDAEINGHAYVGGIFGGIGSSTKNDIKRVINNGDVFGTHFVGGVAGHCGGQLLIYSSGTSVVNYCSKSMYQGGSLKNALNTGLVSGVHYVGGILGEVCSATLSELGNSGDVVGDSSVAGVLGFTAYTTFSSLYNLADVAGKNYVGGLVGYNKEGVSNSAYNIGKVDGDSLVGLVIGYNYNTTMADYYYLEQGEQEPFGKNDGGGVATPKTEKEMKSEEFAKLLGDDFVYEGEWPILKWERE